MEVFLPEVIQTEGEETVICEEDVEQVVEEDDSPADDGSQNVKYVKLCIQTANFQFQNTLQNKVFKSK